MKQIFVATDGSEGGMRAVEFAGRLSARLATPLSIVTVTNPMLNAQWREFGRMEHMTSGDLIDADGQAVLTGARNRAIEQGAQVDKCHALVGDDAADEILGIVAELSPDVIVVCRRGRSRLSGLLLGSVSQKLAGLSEAPVTVVP